MQLLPHQQRIVDLNPAKAILNWEMRVGKTLPASVWVDHPAQAGNTYIICKKSNKRGWQDMGTKATVLTKEEFKKVAGEIVNPTAIVVDECHHFGSALFVKPRSQLATALYTLLKKYPACHFLGLSATPVRNSPWSFHTLLCYLGVYIPWKDWRREFFELQHLPFMKFPAWMPRSDWRARMDKYVRKYTDIVALSEVVDSLPPATSRVIRIKQKPYKRPMDEVVTWVHAHRYEQTGKVKEILELGYKKVILVCKYTDQILELAEALKGEKPVFVLNGQTKDQEETIRQAQEAEECYLIVQSMMGEGWDGWSFGALVFVSMSHTYVEYVQMLGRLRHPKHLKATETLYLLGGVWDDRIYKSLLAGNDFNPHIYVG